MTPDEMREQAQSIRGLVDQLYDAEAVEIGSARTNSLCERAVMLECTAELCEWLEAIADILKTDSPNYE